MRFVQRALPLAIGALLSGHVLASPVGWRQITVPGTPPQAAATVVALYYPAQESATESAVPMGPFTVQAAVQAAPRTTFSGLIVLSHGLAGSELGHTSLAQALARNGYLVASIRHPNDNWQDSSLLQRGAAAYFTERPRQVAHVIDALLQDPDWKDRIGRDATGYRVGALGHSAGGYTVLALAGGQADLSRIGSHCRAESAADPVFCAVGRPAPATEPSPSSQAPSSQASSPQPPSPQATQGQSPSPTTTALLPSLRDPRVRAMVALAPVGVPFTAASLAQIRVPTRIYAAERDAFLVPRFHADWVARNLPDGGPQRVMNASHFAFMDTPALSIQTPGGDIQADPPGFDRAAFLQRLGRELTTFFDQALAASPRGDGTAQ